MTDTSSMRLWRKIVAASDAPVLTRLAADVSGVLEAGANATRPPQPLRPTVKQRIRGSPYRHL